ncbi:hypothetical protein [Sphingomonas abietis]|uniref:DUF2927 domain-containing protein n=1 Tax=Sphingomonas abietis TaxID=3012344 RepID=A0ABY7NMN8_9SPHN|nr:hypothetical protein [Sphingomonas abietis]WBO22095.1 hypothetical protein PBT88_18370 [Sphingomonas abietis]
MRRSRAAFLAFSALSVATAGRSQTPPPEGGDQEIIVEGHTLDAKEIAQAVRTISHPESTGGFDSQYPRWTDRVCVLVAGFPLEGAQFIADRVGQVARGLKLDVGEPGCTPNVFILATNDPTKLIATLRLKRHSLVDGKDVPVLRQVQESHDAVRWIGATSMRGSEGEPPTLNGFAADGRAIPQTNSYNGGSRLVAATRMVLSRETIVVDTTQTDGVNFGQLADYLAFVTLAQLNPHAGAPGVNSILSLFPRGNHAPAGLTAFDKAYLKGLYKSTVNAVGTVQQSQIETSVSDAVGTKKHGTDRQGADPQGQ